MHAPRGVIAMADLSRLRTKYPYVMMLPQARLLEVLAREAIRYPDFELIFGANVQRLVEEDGVVRGVGYQDDHGNSCEVRADLTVAADGRFSKIRHLAGFEQIKTSPPMDVVWFRLPRRASDPGGAAEIHIGGGHFVILLDRGADWQLGYVILKGSFGAVKAAGIETIRKHLLELAPWLGDRVELLHDWKQVAVLNVESGRLPKWHKPGLLFIGDASHTMSPVAGVDINVAIQDAVIAANLLADKLRTGTVTETDLAAVQRAREFAVKVTQHFQRVVQDRIAAPNLRPNQGFQLPWLLRLIACVPGLRDLPANFAAFGPRRVRIEPRLLAAKPT